MTKRRRRRDQTRISGTSTTLFGSPEAKDILRLFFYPLMRAGEFEEFSLTETLHFLLGVDNRTITLYKLTEDIFKMPGLYQYHGARFCESRGLRQYSANENWYVLIRKDSRSSFVDVEFFKKFSDETSYQFRLTEAEFRFIMTKVKLIENNPKWSRRGTQNDSSSRHRNQKGKVLRRRAGGAKT